jgi:hypothetical protein
MEKVLRRRRVITPFPPLSLVPRGLAREIVVFVVDCSGNG